MMTLNKKMMVWFVCIRSIMSRLLRLISIVVLLLQLFLAITITVSSSTSSDSVSTVSTEDSDDKQLSVIVGDMIAQNETIDSSSLHRMTQTTNITTRCVRNQNGLGLAIMNSPDFVPTSINICDKYIAIDGSKPNNITGYSGIHIINKIINFRCIINRNEKCTIDARYKSRHFYVENSTIIMNRLIFLNGNVTKDDVIDHLNPFLEIPIPYLMMGGSLLLNLSIITINNCNFMNNTAMSYNSSFIDGNGGAIDCRDCEITLKNVTMMNNKANFGGAIYINDYSNMTMINVNMINNTATTNGGALYAFLDTKVDIVNTIFTNNSARIDGGAIHTYGSLTLLNVNMTNNKAYQNGGAILTGLGIIEIENAIFHGNSADSSGGAISSIFGNIVSENTVLTNNRAEIGGAIHCFIGEIDLTNSVISNNSAITYGGAIGAVFGNLALRSAVLENNNCVNGTLGVSSSNIDLKDATFPRSATDVDRTDIFYEDENGQETKLNLRPSPPPRPEQTLAIKMSLANIETQISTGQQPMQKCVTNYDDLQKQVRLCDNKLDMDPCVINICSELIQIYKTVSGSRSIDLSNKNIVINCSLKSNERCMIDGRGHTRIFYGSNVDVTFHKIVFSNGYSLNGGSALQIMEKSSVNLLNCSFINNAAKTGGTVTLRDSALYMTGTQSSFINNTGMRPPLVGFSSQLTLTDTLFEGNKKTEYGKGIFLLACTSDLYNITFSASKGKNGNDCNVFVAINPKTFIDGSSCLDATSATE